MGNPVTHKVMRNAKTRECLIHPLEWNPPPGQPHREKFRGSFDECVSYRGSHCKHGKC